MNHLLVQRCKPDLLWLYWFWDAVGVELTHRADDIGDWWEGGKCITKAPRSLTHIPHGAEIMSDRAVEFLVLCVVLFGKQIIAETGEMNL